MRAQLRRSRFGSAHALLGVTVVALLAALSATTLNGQRGGVFRESRDHPAIRYSNGPTTDAVTALESYIELDPSGRYADQSRAMIQTLQQ